MPISRRFSHGFRPARCHGARTTEGFTVAALCKLCGISVALFAVLAPALAAASELSGRGVGVADGDTLTLLHAQTPVRIRLAEIDAGEGPTIRTTLEAVTERSVLWEGGAGRRLGSGQVWPQHRPGLVRRHRRQRGAGATRDGVGL